MSVESSNTSPSSQPARLRTARTVSAYESTTKSGPFARSRAKTVQPLILSEDIGSSEVPVPLAADYDPENGHHPDLFEKRDSIDSDTENNGEEQDRESGEPDQQEELPIELVSLTDR